jgi:hypothetical protein
VEVDLDIHKKLICMEVDLASDEERKISTSFLQRIACTGHIAHFLGKFPACRLIGHVLQKIHVVEF